MNFIKQVGKGLANLLTSLALVFLAIYIINYDVLNTSSVYFNYGYYKQFFGAVTYILQVTYMVTILYVGIYFIVYVFKKVNNYGSNELLGNGKVTKLVSPHQILKEENAILQEKLKVSEEFGNLYFDDRERLIDESITTDRKIKEQQKEIENLLKEKSRLKTVINNQNNIMFNLSQDYYKIILEFKKIEKQNKKLKRKVKKVKRNKVKTK